MSTAAHTPSPWEAVGWFIRTPRSAGGHLVADLSRNGLHAARNADASLIAAAPELLEALSALAQPDDGDTPDLVRARIVIAKAKGGAA